MDGRRGESYYEDLEIEGPVEESFLPSRPAYTHHRDRRHQEVPQVSLPKGRTIVI